MCLSQVIVGAGIGGLTLAYDLEQRGIDYVVLEKAKYVFTSNLLEAWGIEWRSNTIGLAWRMAWYSQSNGAPPSTQGEQSPCAVFHLVLAPHLCLLTYFVPSVSL